MNRTKEEIAKLTSKTIFTKSRQSGMSKPMSISIVWDSDHDNHQKINRLLDRIGMSNWTESIF